MYLFEGHQKTFEICFIWQVWTHNLNVQFLAASVVSVKSLPPTGCRHYKLYKCHTNLSGISELEREGALLCGSTSCITSQSFEFSYTFVTTLLHFCHTLFCSTGIQQEQNICQYGRREQTVNGGPSLTSWIPEHWIKLIFRGHLPAN